MNDTVAAVKKIRVRLAISAEEYLDYYKGRASSVSARAVDGRRIMFPASTLRPFVTEKGVSGLFEITLNPDNRLLSFARISE